MFKGYSFFLFLVTCLTLTACAKTQTIKTSKNSMLVQTSGAPACGVQGSLKVAQQMAAIETIRAGYERYEIVGGDAQNNVSSYTTPGTYHHNGYATGYGNQAFYSGTTTYSPGTTMFTGSNDVALAVKMYNKGDSGYKNAISAKEILGENWEKLVETGVDTCS